LGSSANLGVVLEGSGQANLGGLSASGTASGGEPPTPEPVYGSRGYIQKKIKPKLEPIVEPEIPKINEIKKPQIKTIFAKGVSDLFGLSVQSKSQIDFSILADEAEILTLL